jgi:phosphoribosyl 1,2-cyclic phosphodiesterase
MKVTLWGTRGSLATPGPDTARYGGNTSCVGVRGENGTVLVLDAGTGIRGMGKTIDASVKRIDILLSHLHMDHIQGLGFFAPLFRPDLVVGIWGPVSSQVTLRERLMRYFSPPLFPVSLRELPCAITLHDVPCGEIEIGEFRVTAALVCHPGPTMGYRITDAQGSVVTYLPDHEPTLGPSAFTTLRSRGHREGRWLPMRIC